MNNQDLWNKSTAKLQERTIQSDYAEEKLKLFSPNSIICEIGGGTGIDSLYFLKNGHFVHMIDISDIGLNLATEKAKENKLLDNFKTYQVDLSCAKLPLDDNSVDVIYSRLALHYFRKEKTIEVFKELFRILRNGGKAFFVIKSSEDISELNYLKNTAQEVEENVYDDNGRIKSRFTKNQWREILEKANIKNYQINEYTEDFSKGGDQTKSGNKNIILTELFIIK